jgi:hypothetical protein
MKKNKIIFPLLSAGVLLTMFANPVHATTPEISVHQALTGFISSDGTKVLWDDNRSGNSDLYMKNLKTGVESVIASGAGNQQIQSLSSDGRIVIYVDNAKGYPELFSKNLDTNVVTAIKTGSIKERNLAKTSQDGSVVVYREKDSVTAKLFYKNINTGKEILLRSDLTVSSPSISDNGNIIAFHSSGKVYVRDFSKSQESIVNATVTGNVSQVQISPDGKNVAFVVGNVIYLKNIASNVITTIDANSMVGDLLFTRDSVILIYNSYDYSARNDIFAFNLVSKQTSKIVGSTKVDFATDISNNGDLAFIKKGVTTTDVNLFVQNIAFILPTSTVTTPVTTPQQTELAKAQASVANAKTVVNGDLSTQSAINNAKAILSTTTSEVNALPNGTDKANLLAEIATMNTTIQIAQAKIDVENAVIVVNGDLSTQVAIDNAKSVVATVTEQVNALPNGTDKANLLAEIATMNTTIQTAQAKIDVKNAVIVVNGDLSTQVAIDNAKSVVATVTEQVNALPDGPAKTDLLAQIAQMNITIQVAQATLNVKLAEAVVNGDLIFQLAIDASRSVVAPLASEVNALPNGTAKTDLLSRIDKMKLTIDVAQATLDTKNAEKSAVQVDVSNARLSVAKLPSITEKTSLTGRLDMVQKIIDVDAILSLIQGTTYTTYPQVAPDVNNLFKANDIILSLPLSSADNIYLAQFRLDLVASYDTTHNYLSEKLINILNPKRNYKDNNQVDFIQIDFKQFENQRYLISDQSVDLLAQYGIKQADKKIAEILSKTSKYENKQYLEKYINSPEFKRHYVEKFLKNTVRGHATDKQIKAVIIKYFGPEKYNFDQEEFNKYCE